MKRFLTFLTIFFLTVSTQSVAAKVDQSDLTLIWASQNGLTHMVKALLEKGANANAKNEKGVTPLMKASQNGHIASIKVLLEKGADVNAADKNGNTALQGAANDRVVELLEEAGATGEPPVKIERTSSPQTQ